MTIEVQSNTPIIRRLEREVYAQPPSIPQASPFPIPIQRPARQQHRNFSTGHWSKARINRCRERGTEHQSMLVAAAEVFGGEKSTSDR
jgi:hypothetical protein